MNRQRWQVRKNGETRQQKTSAAQSSALAAITEERPPILSTSYSLRFWMLFLRIPLLLILWTGIAVALMLLAGLFQPVARPRLIILSGTYDHALLPGHRFNQNDAEALISLDQVFEVTHADASSLNSAELKATVREIPRLPRAAPYFPFQKTVDVIYVNCLGLVAVREHDSEPVPVLVPQVSIDQQDEFLQLAEAGLPVGELLDRVSESSADYKVLILDCQQIRRFWPAGVISNQFSDQVKLLVEKRLASLPGVFVLLSCSGDQISWEDDEIGHSLFASFLMSGLTGAADEIEGDGDGLVTLSELTAYLQSKVSNWVARSRADIQQPVLIAGRGHPETVMLADLSHALEPWQPAASEPSGKDSATDPALDSLAAAWNQYHSWSTRTPAPYQYAPASWRALEQSLLEAELAWLAGDDAHLKHFLNQAKRLFQTLPSERAWSVSPQSASSIPMNQLLVQLAATDSVPASPASKSSASTPPPQQPAKGSQAAEASDAEPASTRTASAGTSPAPDTVADRTTPSSAATPAASGESATPLGKESAGGKTESELTPEDCVKLVNDVLLSKTPIAQAGITLRNQAYSDPILPAEAELLVMMVGDRPETSSVFSSGWESQGLSLVQSRRTAEQAAVPQGRMAPRVYLWVRQWVDAADRLQRLREDRFLNHGGVPLPIGASRNVEPSNPQVQYEQCIEIGIRISRAVQFLDQIRAEVPYYAESDRSRFVAAGQDETLTLWSPSGIGELFQDLRRLEFLLNSPQTAASIEQQIETADQIDHLRLQIAGRRQKLIGDIDREYHTLAAMLADGGIRTGAAWRRVNCILRFPFVYSGESAEAIVSRRMELLKGIRSSDDSIRTSSQSESIAADSSRSESPAEELNQLAVSYYRLADWQQNPVVESPQLIAGCNPELKQIWRRLYDLLRPAADLSGTASLAQANVANLLLDPAVASLASGSRLQSICEELQRLEFAEFVLWHSRRRGEDFWAGQGRSGTDYFSAAARQYFTLAASVDASSAGLSSAISAKARLTELQTLSDAMSQVPPGGWLKFSSERVLFRGVDQSDVSLSVSPSPGTPEGIASVQLLADLSRLRIRPPTANTAGSGSGPLPFSIERIHDLTFSDSLTGELNFRGHRCRLPLAVQSLGSDDGRTVGYTLPASSEGSINVLLGQVSPNATQLLFVLDCSRSMLEDSRLAELKQSLSRLSKQNISNGLNVGIRVFGDRVVWNKGEPASEAAAKTDSRLIMPLQPYSNQPFQQAVSELQAVGETPLYYALLQAQGDFPLGSSGEKQIVVISDGMDNWAAAGESPGLAELKDAYQGSGIRIDCIGFHSDEFGFQSLQAISAATGGTCVQITSADSLLDSVFQLANTLQYQIRNVSDASNPKVVQTGNLRFLNQPPYQGTPDEYDVAVLDHRGKLLTPRVPLTLRNGQQLSLVYGGSKLGYQPVDFSAEIASVTNSDAGVTMHVMSADVTDQTNLTVTLGLSHASDPNWWPGFTRISVTPAGSAQPYVFAQGTPNQPRQQFPFWQFTLSDWPQGVTSAEVEIQWAESSGDAPTQYISDCSENKMAFQPELPDGVELTRREFRKIPIAGSEQNAFMLTLVLPAADRQLGEWSLSVSSPVKAVRRTSNYRANLLNSYFVIANDQPPERITVYGPSMTAKRPSLKSTIRLTPKTVNANP